MPTTPTGRRHYPEDFVQAADLGVDRFDKRSAAEMERAFPAMVRAGGPWHVDDHAAQQLPVGEERGHTSVLSTSCCSFVC